MGLRFLARPHPPVAHRDHMGGHEGGSEGIAIIKAEDNAR